MTLITYLWPSEGTTRLLFTRQSNIQTGEIHQRDSCRKEDVEICIDQAVQQVDPDDTQQDMNCVKVPVVFCIV